MHRPGLQKKKEKKKLLRSWPIPLALPHCFCCRSKWQPSLEEQGRTASANAGDPQQPQKADTEPPKKDFENREPLLEFKTLCEKQVKSTTACYFSFSGRSLKSSLRGKRWCSSDSSPKRSGSLKRRVQRTISLLSLISISFKSEQHRLEVSVTCSVWPLHFEEECKWIILELVQSCWVWCHMLEQAWGCS